MRRRVWTTCLAMALVGAAALLLMPGTRAPILRAAGRVLVVNDPIAPADIIIVTADAGTAGLLEASDLVHSGAASRVAVFATNFQTADGELARRGVTPDDPTDTFVRELRALGVESVERIPPRVVGTEDEGVVLPRWCDEHQIRSAIVVSASDHSRRLRRVLRRSIEGHQTQLAIRSARYSVFDPDRWWRSRAGIRTGIIEFEKLVLDIARHPLS